MLRPTVLSFVLVIIGLVLTNQAYGQGDRPGGRRGSNTEREPNRGSDKPSDSNGESSVTATRLDDSRPRGDLNGGSRPRGDSNSGSRSGDDLNGNSRPRDDLNGGSRPRGDLNGGSRPRGDSNRVPTLGDNMNIAQHENPPVSSDSNPNSMFIRNPNTVRPISTNVPNYSNDPRINRNDGSSGNRFEERPTVPNRNRVEPYGPYQRPPAYGRYSYGYNGYQSPYAGNYGHRRYPGNRFFNQGFDRGYRQPYRRYRRSDVDGPSDPVFYAKNWNAD